MGFAPGARQPLRQMFCGCVEQVFNCDLGICNTRLTDYLGTLLSEFVHVDQIFRLRRVDGEVIREVSRMEAEVHLAQVVPGSVRTCLVHRYIGDFTLFWTGVFPEALRPRHAGTDRLHEYVLQGKRGYEIAGELSVAGSEPSPELLRELSREFEACVHGLHLVRESWRQRSSPFGPMN